MEHGGEIYNKKIKYDFSINVNPLGMPKKAEEALLDATKYVGQYPDTNATKLVEAICGYHGFNQNLDKNKILVTNGAAEFIYALACAMKPKKALIVSPTFSEYEKAVLLNGGTIFYTKLLPDNLRSLPGYMGEKRSFASYCMPENFVDKITEDIDIVFLCNPNNPTGNILAREYLSKVLTRCYEMNCYLCVDECFLPFLRDEKEYTMICQYAKSNEDIKEDELKYYEKLIVIRAFTKIYGMAGLRLGYGVVYDDLLSVEIRRQIQPWNTSVLAQAAGVEALNDTEYLQKTYQWLEEERKYLMDTLSDMTEFFEVYDGVGNFILLYGGLPLDEILLEHGILIRNCSNFHDMGYGMFRIGIRSHEENVVLVETLRKILGMSE